MAQDVGGVFYWRIPGKGTVQFTGYIAEDDDGQVVTFTCVVGDGEWQLVTDPTDPPFGIELAGTFKGFQLVGVPRNTKKTDGIDPIVAGHHAKKAVTR